MNNFVILAKTEKELEKYTIGFLKIIKKHNCVLNSQNVISMPQKYLY